MRLMREINERLMREIQINERNLESTVHGSTS